MAVEKEITENQDEEIKVEEEQNTPTIPENIEIEGEAPIEEPITDDFGANLAEDLDERTRRRLGLELIGEYKKDKESRKDSEEG